MLAIDTNNIVNPINIPQNSIAFTEIRKESVGNWEDKEFLFRKFNDIYSHYFFPVSRQKEQDQYNNWINYAQSLFPGIRSFTAEEAEIHKQGLMRLFKPTGRNRYKKC